MRDSWIDKDEFDELVQSFSPSKRRKKSSRARKLEKTSSTEPEPPQEESSEPAQAPVEQDDSVAISSIDLIDEYAVPPELVNEDVSDQENEVVEWDVAQVEIVGDTPALEVEDEKQDFVIEEIVEESELQSRGIHFFSCDGVDDEVNAELDATSRASDSFELDTVKAIRSLAEARSRADQGGLIRQRGETVKIEPENHFEDGEIDDKDVGNPILPEIEEDGDEQSFVNDILDGELFASIPGASSEDGSGFTREETTRRRMQKFASLLHEKLDASSVMVMDGEGFPLYEESNGSSSIPIEKSGGPLRLVYEMQGVVSSVGLEDRVSTQVSIGNGQWLCLLYSAESEDDGPMVRAVVPGPLESDQLRKWSNLLGAALLFDDSNGS